MKILRRLRERRYAKLVSEVTARVRAEMRTLPEAPKLDSLQITLDARSLQDMSQLRNIILQLGAIQRAQ